MGDKSRRSLVCNPQLVADCNHFEEMYVIRNLFRYVINPKEYTPAVMPYTLRVITCAYRRLHTNPSDWIKNKTVRRLSCFLAPPAGLEPATSCINTIYLRYAPIAWASFPCLIPFGILLRKTQNIAVITSATLRFPINQTPLIQVKQESKKRRECECTLFFFGSPCWA